MKEAKVVLGLGLGDEGKGLTVDYLCDKAIKEKKEPLVVRFSGGPNAGHTVHVDGKSHVHSTFGSGTLRHNVPTFIAEEALFCPISYLVEREILQEKGVDPKLYIHPKTQLIIPADIINNRADAMGFAVSTTGKGIGKAMSRIKRGTYKFYAYELLHPERLIQRVIKANRRLYIAFAEDLEAEMETFKEAIRALKEEVIIVSNIILNYYDFIVFEGSQGILLDQDHGEFPHVTYAHTTGRNAYDLLRSFDTSVPVEIVFVTRTYATRHGSGRFTEKDVFLKNNEDETNVLNDFQGKFKVGEIDYDELIYAMQTDSLYIEGIFDTAVSLMVTCNDQTEKGLDYSKLKRGFYNIYESYSPDSKDVKHLKNKVE